VGRSDGEGCCCRVPAGRRHAVLAEDGIVNGVLHGSAPLYAGAWATTCGVPSPTVFLSPEWSRGLRVELNALRPSPSPGQFATGRDEPALDHFGRPVSYMGR
jgi:hypothetical protein